MKKFIEVVATLTVLALITTVMWAVIAIIVFGTAKLVMQ